MHNGHARAQSRLGFAYQSGFFDQAINDEEALKWYRQATEGGDDAQTRLAEAYEGGKLGLVTGEVKALK